jgi:hypothetical protein
MPPLQSPFSNIKESIKLAYILEIEQATDGSISYVVRDSKSNLYSNVKAISIGSRSDKYSHSPYQINDKVLISVLKEQGLYYIIGGIQGGNTLKKEIKTSLPDNKAFYQDLSYRDTIFANKESLLALSENNAIVQSHNIKLQLTGGQLIIATDNNGGSVDYAMNSQTFIETTFPLLLAMEKKINALQTAMVQIAPNTLTQLEAAAVAADANVPGSGEVFREQARQFSSALEDALGTVLPSVDSAKDAANKYAVNKKVLLPK